MARRGSVVNRVSVKGDEELIAELRTVVPTKTRKAVRDAVDHHASRVETEAKRRVPRDTSSLGSVIRTRTKRGGLIADVGVFEGARDEQGNQVNYAPYVEFGRGPGKAPPVGPLKDWVRRVTTKPEGFAYYVQDKIAAEGTEPQPFLVPAFKFGKQGFKSTIRRNLSRRLG